MRALVAGWFSFTGMGATAGDVMARDVVCDWLDEAGLSYDVALAPLVKGGIDWRQTNPSRYSHVIFVCGPFGNGVPVTEFLEHFAGRRLIGVDLSMLQSVDEWNPFDLLLERDSNRTTRPDSSFLSRQRKVPVIGLCLAHRQQEYGDRGRHEAANQAIRCLLASREVAVVSIDTRLEDNAGGLRTAAEVETLIARMDAVVTTRLHGLALALKNGVPALAIDPVAGGAKVRRQAEVLGWPAIFDGGYIDVELLSKSLDYCLSDVARVDAQRCAQRAIAKLSLVRQEFIHELRETQQRRGCEDAPRALVAGWFSWQGYNATAGDLMAADVARDWLQEAGIQVDVAVAESLPDGLDWMKLDPACYSHLVFVCGPFRNISPAITDFLAKFSHCFRVGLDLSMLRPVAEWNPFDLLVERDSDRTGRPDISFLCRQPKVPVVGRCLAHRQKEYGKRGRHDEVNQAIRRLLASRDISVVPIDTVLDANAGQLRTSAEIESLIAKMDALVTTRLHGLALALKNGVPALAIDPVAGGAKVSKQAECVGWRTVFNGETLDEQELEQSLDHCLSEPARAAARRARQTAIERLAATRDTFISGLGITASAAVGG